VGHEIRRIEMPEVICDLTECKYNQVGKCENDNIELDATGNCQTYEDKE
jgi:hypothetical protein